MRPVSQIGCPLRSQSEILALELVRTSTSATADKSSYEVLVAHKDGLVYTLSHKLEEPIWETKLSAHATHGLEHVLLTTAKEVKSGLLAHRPDALAYLNKLVGDWSKRLSTIQILLVIKRGRNGLEVSILATKPSNIAKLGFEEPFQTVIDYQIPSIPIDEEGLEYSWNVRSGLLHIKGTKAISSFLFSSGLPQQTPMISDTGSDIKSHQAVDGALILAQSGSSLTLYDANYCSIQDRKVLTTLDLGISRKRKRLEQSSSTTRLRFFAYFSDLGLVLALQGPHIIAIQISAQARSRKEHKNGSRLLNSIQKGIKVSPAIDDDIRVEIGEPILEADLHSWRFARAKLFDFAFQNDIEAFDECFASEVGMDYIPAKGDFVAQWKFPPGFPVEQQLVRYRSKALFALRCIFAYKPIEKMSSQTAQGVRESSLLKIEFFPPNTFQWLVTTGQLSIDLIEHGYRLFAQDLPIVPQQKSDLFQAIAELDPSLEVMSSIIKHATHLDIDDVALCLKFILNSYEDFTVDSLPVFKSLVTEADVRGNYYAKQIQINQKLFSHLPSAENIIAMRKRAKAKAKKEARQKKEAEKAERKAARRARKGLKSEDIDSESSEDEAIESQIDSDDEGAMVVDAATKDEQDIGLPNDMIMVNGQLTPEAQLTNGYHSPNGHLTNGHGYHTSNGRLTPQSIPHPRLTNGTSAHSATPELSNGVDHELQSPTQDLVIAETDIDKEIATIDAALEELEGITFELAADRPYRGEALSRAICNLYTFSPGSVTHVLRKYFTAHELVFLIHILREEMTHSGWFIPYWLDSFVAAGITTANNAMSPILELLNRTLDAIGLGEFVAASAADPSDSVDQLINALNLEFKAGMQSLDETRDIASTIQEFLQVAHKTRTRYRANHWIRNKQVIKTLTPKEIKLQWGMTLDDELMKTRMTGGGQTISRSKRDIMRQISKKVPEYSIEVIRPELLPLKEPKKRKKRPIRKKESIWIKSSGRD